MQLIKDSYKGFLINTLHLSLKLWTDNIVSGNRNQFPQSKCSNNQNVISNIICGYLAHSLSPTSKNKKDPPQENFSVKLFLLFELHQCFSHLLCHFP